MDQRLLKGVADKRKPRLLYSASTETHVAPLRFEIDTIRTPTVCKTVLISRIFVISDPHLDELNW